MMVILVRMIVLPAAVALNVYVALSGLAHDPALNWAVAVFLVIALIGDRTVEMK